MAEHGMAESVYASIRFRTYNSELGAPRLLVAACGGATLFEKVSYLAAEMAMRGFSNCRVDEDALCANLGRRPVAPPF